MIDCWAEIPPFPPELGFGSFLMEETGFCSEGASSFVSGAPILACFMQTGASLHQWDFHTGAGHPGISVEPDLFLVIFQQEVLPRCCLQSEWLSCRFLCKFKDVLILFFRKF